MTDPFLGLVGMALHLNLAEPCIGMVEKKVHLMLVDQQKVTNLCVQLRGLFAVTPM